MESVSLWWPCSYSNNNNFKYINITYQPDDMFPEGQPNFKEQSDVNIKNYSLFKEDKRQFILESHMDAHSPQTE